MLVVAALGGNALLRRGEPLTAEAQRANVKIAADSLAEIVRAAIASIFIGFDVVVLEMTTLQNHIVTAVQVQRASSACSTHAAKMFA